MIMQVSRSIIDCPVCGRPVEIQSEYIGRELACGHCRGRFVVQDNEDGQLTATNHGGTDSLVRADELLQHTRDVPEQDPFNGNGRLHQLRSVLDDTDVRESCDTSRETHLDKTAAARPTALLVEHRDEVFARVAADMQEAGMYVIRAMSGLEALKLCGVCEPTLVVANTALPDQSGWLLAGKLRFVHGNAPVWLYQPQSSAYDEGMAAYLQVDKLIDYGGDLFDLSETILELMAECRAVNRGSSDSQNAEEPVPV